MCETQLLPKYHPAPLLSCLARPLVPEPPLAPTFPPQLLLVLRLELQFLVLGSGSICMVAVFATPQQFFLALFLFEGEGCLLRAELTVFC